MNNPYPTHPRSPMDTPTILTPPAFNEYWPGQGGFYGGTMPATPGLPARHLIFSMDEATGLTYGPYGLKVPGADSRTDGRANTAALLASEQEHPAAQWAADYQADGHSDFYLPSQAELFIASLCAPQRFDKRVWYFSSTQGSSYDAFAQDFEDGRSDAFSKCLEFRVRALRAIPAL